MNISKQPHFLKLEDINHTKGNKLTAYLLSSLIKTNPFKTYTRNSVKLSTQ